MLYTSDAKATRAYLETRVNVHETVEHRLQRAGGRARAVDERCCRLS